MFTKFITQPLAWVGLMVICSIDMPYIQEAAKESIKKGYLAGFVLKG